jgi:hypothetical protein
MGKTIRKGIKLGIPSVAEGWYEQTIQELKEDVEKRGKSMFKRSKVETDIAARFRDFLFIAEKDIEIHLWLGKSYSARNGLDKEVEYELNSLFGQVIQAFNNILKRLDPSSLSDDLLNHLNRELKLLNKQASELDNIAYQNPHSSPQANDAAKRLIGIFETHLRAFSERMEPLLKEEEPQEADEGV